MSEQMSDTVSLEIADGIAVVTIDNPPVNALGATVRQGLVTAAERIDADDAIHAGVVTAKGRTFPAGADITEFATGMKEPFLPQVLERLEAVTKPLIAAVFGTTLGGGLEVAMACHYRVAAQSTKLGLPEVKLGILPGAGGTQRLPRLVGAEAGLQVMVSGRPVAAPLAEKMGLVDKVVADDALLAEALAFAAALAKKGGKIRRTSELTEWTEKDRADPELFDRFKAEHGREFRGVIAPGKILESVQAAVNLPFAEGIKAERANFMQLVASDQSKALRHVFFAMRQSAKVPGIDKDTPLIDVKTVGVIGAGTMGGGIAMCFANAGIPVTLVEVKQEALERGLGVIRKNYENTAKKGRMSAEDVETRMGLITGSLAMEDLGEVDLVIEAVFEAMEVKEQIFSKLDKIAKPGAILASNTSFLDIDHIATFTSRPEMVLGLHFFSPANVMPLLEVVRGAKSSDSVIATGMKLAGKLRKTPVLSGVCFGFIANRLMYPYIVKSQDLLLTGTSMKEIDAAMSAYGFAMGPIAMIDLVGLDIVKLPSKNLMSELVARDRLGQKKNGGFYDYDERRRGTPSPVAEDVIAELAKERGVERRDLGPDEIVAELLYPVVNEGARILEEGIALRAGDIDVAAILGYNWPAYQGGPMCWADMHGLDKIVAGLETMGIEPAAILKKLASEGGSFT